VSEIWLSPFILSRSAAVSLDYADPGESHARRSPPPDRCRSFTSPPYADAGVFEVFDGD